ncbi:MAG: T9SS type A sorting domain-containing protein [Saprospiraceae bacterium]
MPIFIYTTQPGGTLTPYLFGQVFSKRLNLNISSTNHIEDIKVSTVYPNPTGDYLFIESDSQLKGVKILDRMGNLLREGFQNNQIDVSELLPGIYYLLLIHADGQKELKRIVKM